MRTRALMTLSALLMAALGLGASFLPQEILSYLGVEVRAVEVLMVQVLGALYLGCAILNWMARGNLIGGVYSRPVALGNFVHFAVVAITLLKAIPLDATAPIIAGAVVYTVFAVWFGLVVFTKMQA